MKTLKSIVFPCGLTCYLVEDTTSDYSGLILCDRAIKMDQRGVLADGEKEILNGLFLTLSETVKAAPGTRTSGQFSRDKAAVSINNSEVANGTKLYRWLWYRV